MNIDVTKPVKTRDGRKARYVTTLANAETYPLVFAVTPSIGDTTEYLMVTALSGKNYVDGQGEEPSDIVQAPVTVERFMNVYPQSGYVDAETAWDIACGNAVGTLRLTYEDDKLVSSTILAD